MLFLQFSKIVSRIVKSCYSRRLYHNIEEQYKRGLYHDIFPSDASNEVAKLLKTPQCIYAGFDPTADSLHIGNLIILVGLLHWQRNGHHVIAVVGSATASVGDPSGRSASAGARPTLGAEQLHNNAAGLRENIERVFSNHENHMWPRNSRTPLGRLTILDNIEWMSKVNAASFASRIGRHLRLGQLMSRDSVRTRLTADAGLSLAELCYQAFQAYDWLHLHEEYGCRFQLGGADQMGNITTGHELLSRVKDTKVYGLTMPLVTSETGDKLGKSAGNSLWLAPSRTSPFELYQFLLQRSDAEAPRLLRQLTLESEAEVASLASAEPERRLAQHRLASRVVQLVHGLRGLAEARATTDALYGGSLEALAQLSPGDAAAALRGAPLRRLPLTAATSALDLAMAVGCFASESDARRIMAAGGFRLNHQRTSDPDEILSRVVHILPNNLTLIRVGKKNFYVVEWIP